jgi:hypothetical protein
LYEILPRRLGARAEKLTVRVKGELADFWVIMNPNTVSQAKQRSEEE